MNAWRRVAVAALLLQGAGGWAAAPDEYETLVALFAEWRAFQRPVMRDGVPDYTPAAMGAQQQQLKAMRARLDAIDRDRLSVPQRVDWELVSAEMNGLDFDHRVLRPWARDPAFYTVVIDSESDTPLREGPSFPAAIELWRLSFPLTRADAAALGARLRALPRILHQARGNLVEGCHDLWWLGIRSQKAQAATLAGLARTLADTHPELVPDAESARDAVTAFASWLEPQLPERHGSCGVGVANYDWYLRHVERVPFGWRDELVLMERELARATTYLKLAEQRNQGLPPLEPPAGAADGQRRADRALESFLAFLREKRVFTVPDYAAPALAEHLRRFKPPEERDFFDEVALRDPRVMLCHSVHWIDKARLRREPHASPIRREPALYNIWVSRAEGFATAMEELALGAGLFDDSPRSRELVYVMVAQRAARAIASLRVHANEWTIPQAIAFASRTTPRGWLRPDGELVFFEQQLYLQQPGYGTSYLSGKALVDELVAERAREQGDAFDLGRTLDALFATGMIPVSLARYELTGSPGTLLRNSPSEPARGPGSMTSTGRDVLHKCLALGGVSVAAGFSPKTVIEAWAVQGSSRAATPVNEIGPCYKRLTPNSSVLRLPGDMGLPLAVLGKVWSTRGEALPGAAIEVWQADHAGHYDLEGYRYPARVPADAEACYSLETTMPGHYPARVCQHTHYLVQAPGHKPLITQLYFATDPAFEGNADRKFTRDPLIRSRELVRPVTSRPNGKEVCASVSFEQRRRPRA